MSAYSEYKQNLSKLVLSARKRAHLTQEKLCELAKISDRTLQGIEKGDANPQFEVLISLVRTLDIDPRLIFSPQREDSPTKDKLLMEISACSAKEAEIVYEICHALIVTLRKFHI